ncbi:hypothetical protein MJG53_004187 [Ovis ammon polii x Ovis aries]|uniref:Uncharacterized protein n=1 Tax=Ovis ammon polii x Ovis aries TaxID=2918886 RepID=A0ACB9V905_9CETA|nr:hypothetical protein MJG53_004187 [Ovis ammon polii x Ovis aries]
MGKIEQVYRLRRSQAAKVIGGTSLMENKALEKMEEDEIRKIKLKSNVNQIDIQWLLKTTSLTGLSFCGAVKKKGRPVRTVLHLACANGRSAVVTFLLERKCLLNLCDNEKKTVLMKAVECQEEECATLLLEHGANPNVMDICGNTALHYAVFFFCQNLSLTAKLLSYNAYIEARNKDDLIPLLLAIHERRGQMVEFLVKKEANIHAVDKMKRTALMLAVKYDSPNVVRRLLQQGVDIFFQDVFGWIAEEYAIIGDCISFTAQLSPSPLIPLRQPQLLDSGDSTQTLWSL